MATLKPIDGWGFLEAVDGVLSARFDVEIAESEVEFAPLVKGWKATALNGKYDGAYIEITPRHTEWSEIVVLNVYVDRLKSKCLFSGMAETTGLECKWL